MNPNDPATKQDLETAVQAAKRDLSEAKDEFLEAIRGIETKLPQAFYGYAKNNDARLL